jgi:rod shape-determining protein MreD
MRYLIMALMVLLCVFISGGAFGAVSPFGLAPDIMLCFMTSIAIMEKSLSAMALGVVYGLILDILYSPALGFYAIPYAVCGSILFFVIKRFRFMDNFLIPMAIAAAAFVIKDLVTIGMSYLLALTIDPGYILVRFTLLSAVETGVLTLATHILVRWLYKIRALKTLRYDDVRFKM